MNQLELIWELENHNNILDKYKEEYETNNNNIDLINIENNIKTLDNTINNLLKELEEGKYKIKKLELKLKNNDFKLKDIDKDLYNGEISDLKQLEFLNEEKTVLKNIIDKEEIKILLLMESMDQIKESIIKSQRELKRIKILKDETIINLESMNNNIIDKIKQEEKILESLRIDIDEALLKRYNVLRKNKGSGIVSINKYICSGCNMIIPTYLGEALKNKIEIVYCESCGRILYYLPKDE